MSNDSPKPIEADPELNNGPIQKRCCTDIICWLIWVAACTFWVITVIYGISKGNPSAVFAPWDEDGNQCGHSTVTKDYSYGYFYQALDVTNFADYKNKLFCVKKCPTYTDNPSMTQLKTFGELSIACHSTTNS